MLTQFGHVEVIKSIETNCDDRLCDVLFRKEYKEFYDSIIGKTFLQDLAKGEVML